MSSFKAWDCPLERRNTLSCVTAGFDLLVFHIPEGMHIVSLHHFTFSKRVFGQGGSFLSFLLFGGTGV
jgi:hypothetical protein